MEVETMHCPVCGQDHEIVGRTGGIPILHCPSVDPREPVFLSGDLGRRQPAC